MDKNINFSFFLLLSILISFSFEKETENSIYKDQNSFSLYSPSILESSQGKCSNTGARSVVDCYLLDPINSKNLCSMYHVALKKKEFGKWELEDYSKCMETEFTKKSVEEIKKKEMAIYEDEIEILSFGLTASGHNLCTEYSYQDTTRDKEKTKNYCKQSKVNFKGNKCCYMKVNATMGGDVSEDNRCYEIENDSKAKELADLIVRKVEGQGAIEVYTDYECYNVEESSYGSNSNFGGSYLGNKVKLMAYGVLLLLL